MRDGRKAREGRMKKTRPARDGYGARRSQIESRCPPTDTAARLSRAPPPRRFMKTNVIPFAVFAAARRAYSAKAYASKSNTAAVR